MTSLEQLSLEKSNAINVFMPFWNLVEKVKTFHFLNFILDYSIVKDSNEDLTVGN